MLTWVIYIGIVVESSDVVTISNILIKSSISVRCGCLVEISINWDCLATLNYLYSISRN